MSKISELSDGGSLQSTDFLIAVRSGGNVKVQADGAVTGTTGQFSGNVSFADNAKAIFGAGSDLQVFHNGTDSFIREVGTGGLKIDTNGPDITLRVNATESAIVANSNGSVDLYYDNSQKLATTATGIDVTGTVTADGLTVDASEANILGGSSTAGSTTTLIIGSGTNTPDSVHGIQFRDRYGTSGFPDGQIGAFIQAERSTTSANYDLVLGTTTSSASDAIEHLRISHEGNVGIGTDDPTVASGNGLAIYDATVPRVQLRNSASGDTSSDGAGIFMSGSDLGIENRESSNIIFYNNSEAMRIDQSQNLLVGSTTLDQANNSNTANCGINLLGSGIVSGSTDGATVAYFNRLTSDGDIVSFRKDGTTVGSIGSAATGTRLYVGNSASGRTAALVFVGSQAIYPFDGFSEANTDGTISLGSSFARFDDIYATNGTIQTSDANEKQDVAQLDEAERRVAVAAKGLLRKFRWKDSVAEKGDEARIHFGIIAQDLQAAFEAEGLDAGRYAMFIHSTWTDEETGEERSRMGVRYSELLAFIIAAL